MKTIQVVNTKTLENLEVVVDNFAYEFLKDRKFGVYGDTARRPYIRVSIQGHWIPIHKLLCGDYQNIDHINGNQLDNRLENLRGTTSELNGFNRRKQFFRDREPTSSFKGVCKRKAQKLWYAAITCKGERHYLGYFKTETEAAKAYDEKARELFGEYAKLNFE